MHGIKQILVHYVDLKTHLAANGIHGFAKVAQLKEWMEDINPDCLIEVDGGVSASNAAALVAAGAEILVAGSAVFKAESPGEVIEAMRG